MLIFFLLILDAHAIYKRDPRRKMEDSSSRDWGQGIGVIDYEDTKALGPTTSSINWFIRPNFNSDKVTLPPYKPTSAKKTSTNVNGIHTYFNISTLLPDSILQSGMFFGSNNDTAVSPLSWLMEMIKTIDVTAPSVATGAMQSSTSSTSDVQHNNLNFLRGLNYYYGMSSTPVALPPPRRGFTLSTPSSVLGRLDSLLKVARDSVPGLENIPGADVFWTLSVKVPDALRHLTTVRSNLRTPGSDRVPEAGRYIQSQKLPKMVIPEIIPSNNSTSVGGRGLGDVFRPPNTDDLIIYPWEDATTKTTTAFPNSQQYATAAYYPGRQLPETEAPATIVSAIQTVQTTPPPPPPQISASNVPPLPPPQISAPNVPQLPPPQISATALPPQPPPPSISAPAVPPPPPPQPPISAPAVEPPAIRTAMPAVSAVSATLAVSEISATPAAAVSAVSAAPTAILETATVMAGEQPVAQYGSYGPIEEPNIAEVMSYASEVSTTTTVTIATTPAPSTPDPLLLEMKKDMSAPNVGYFSSALTKLFELIAAKDEVICKKLFYATQSVMQKKSDELRLEDLGYPLQPALVKGSAALALLPTDMVQKNIGTGAYLMRNRNLLDSSYNEAIYELDRLYTMREGEKLFQSIVDINNFPQNGKREKYVMERLLAALMSPFVRLQGSDRIRNVLTLVNGLIEEKFPSLMAARKNRVAGRRSNPESKYYAQRKVRPRSRIDEYLRTISNQIHHKASKSHSRDTTIFQNRYSIQITPKTMKSYKKKNLRSYSRDTTIFKNRYSIQITPKTMNSYEKKNLRSYGLSIETDRDYDINHGDYGVKMVSHRHKMSKFNKHEKHKIKKHLKNKHRKLYEKLKYNHNKGKTTTRHTKVPLPINRLIGDGNENVVRSKYMKLNHSINNIDGRKRLSRVKSEPAPKPTIQKRFNIIYTRSPLNVVTMKKTSKKYLPSLQLVKNADSNIRKYLLKNSIKSRFKNFKEADPKSKSKFRASAKEGVVRKGIFSDSSYSEDEENTLKFKLHDTLRHGERRFAERLYQTKTRKINEMSSYSDEESIIKRNLYKVFAT